MTDSRQGVPRTADNAIAFFQAGNLRAALATAEGVLREEPDDLAMLELASIAAQRIGWMDDAIRHWTKLTVLQGEETGLLTELAELLLNAGRRDEAVNAAQRAFAGMPQDVDACHHLARVMHHLGQVDDADELYRRAASRAPNDPDIAYNHGVLLQQAGRTADATIAYRRALALRPGTPKALVNLALMSWMADPAEAERCYREAIRIQPDYADAYHHLGTLLVHSARYDEANRMLERAVQLQPGNAAAQNDLGLLRREQGRYEEAESAFRRAISAQAGFAPALINLGALLRQLGRAEESAALLGQAIDAAPGMAAAHVNYGLLCRQLGRHTQAEEALNRAVALSPHDPDGYYNRALLHRDKGRYSEAEKDYRAALSLQPEHRLAWANLALLLQRCGRHGEAEAILEEALRKFPNFVEAMTILGNVQMDVQRVDDAESSFRRALAIAPGNLSAGFNLGLLLLKRGSYEDGWPLFDLRNDPRRPEGAVANVNLPFPVWHGEPLAGKAIMVWYEQGLGDQIQFCRYVPMIKQAGAARVAIVCTPPLKELLRSLRGVDEVYSITDSADLIEGFDYWTPLLSLPRYCNTVENTIPAAIPYLAATDDKRELWHARLSSMGLRVGLAWRGNPDHVNDHNRSLPSLTALAPLWEVPAVRFVALQKGFGEEEARQPPSDQPLLYFGDDLNELSDTAGLIANLDLVITIDSAVAHLAGAMGKPCWVMLPFVGCDWRWMQERTDTPWYPGVLRLFRQPEPGAWQAVVEQVCSELRALAADRTR